MQRLASQPVTPETIRGRVYDYPLYYDLIFAADWKAEFSFLRACFRKFAKRRVKRLFEPACGTGRLLVKFAEAGYQIGGNDVNLKAVDFCNKRLERHGFEPAAVVGDMTDFKLDKPADAMFNLINSFRHLQSDKEAESHFRCAVDSLAPGGLFILSMHLTPKKERATDEETWRAFRGALRVRSKMWSIKIDHQKRQERVGMTYDVKTPKRHFILRDEMIFRTYTPQQMQKLIDRTKGLELVETFDFNYDIKQPVEVDNRTEDVVYVMRRR
jgi:SAM-dependent methyltransferase